MAYDLLIKNGTVVDGTGAPRGARTSRSRMEQIAEIGKVSERRATHHRRRRTDRRAGLRRSAYPLRCANLLGSAADFVLMARRDLGRDGQLRSRYRAVQARGSRDRGVGPGQRRGDSLRRAEQGHHLGLGELSRVHGRGRAPRSRNQRRLSRAAHAVSPFRDGRGIDGAGGDAQRDPAHRGVAARGDGGGRDGLFHHHARRSTSAFSGQPLACRLASRDELKACSNVLKELGKRRDRNRAHASRLDRCSTTNINFLDFLLTESARPVTWLAMASRPDKPEYAQETLARPQPLIRRGGVPQVLCSPFVIQIDLRNPFSFADMERGTRSSISRPRRRRGSIADPQFPRRLPQGADTARHLFNGKWHRLEVLGSRQARAQGAGAADRRRHRRASAASDPSTRSSTSRWRTTSTSSTRWRMFNARGGHRRADRRPAHDARTFRRRRARRYAVRRRLLHLPARQVGARAPGADARARRQAHHVGAGRLLRHPAPRTSAPGTRRRRRDLRLRHRRLGQTRARCTTICRAADGAW